VLADASAASLRPFVTANVEPGSRVITDGWVGYNGLAGRGYDHERRNQKAAARRGEDPGDLLPAVHRISSLCKRWLLGTHQGSVDPAHLPAYLNEFVFRFNRRHSRSRGLVFYRVLELAAGHDPLRYDDILATRKPRSQPPQRRGTGHPPTLDRPAAARPWRTAEMQLPFPLRLSAYPGHLIRRDARVGVTEPGRHNADRKVARSLICQRGQRGQHQVGLYELAASAAGSCLERSEDTDGGV